MIASCNVQLTNMHQSQIADKEFDYMANIILIHPSICDSVLETHIFGCCFIQTGYTWGTWGEIDMEAWPSYCGLCPWDWILSRKCTSWIGITIVEREQISRLCLFLRIFPGGKESRSNVRNRQSGKSSPERIKQLGTKFSSNQASKLGYFFCVSKLCNRVMPHSSCSNNF